MDEVFRAFDTNRALILAAETWAEGFKEAPEQYAKLLKTDARLERKILQSFKEFATNTNSFINWYAYQHALYEVKASRVDAYQIEVIVDDNAINQQNDAFITIMFEDIAFATALGAQAGETIYKIPLGIGRTDADIQLIAHKFIANLVGKTWDEAQGKYVNNPDADYKISDRTREDIRASIQTSINLGEDTNAATKRMQRTIKNPLRARTIANTEIVNAYDGGLQHFGEKSGAIGKEWEDTGAIDVCAEYSALGPVPFDYLYGGELNGPTAHPNCRCHRRLIYQNELDTNPDLFNSIK